MIALKIDATICIRAVRTMEFSEGFARLIERNREVCSLGYEFNPSDKWFDKEYASVHDLWTKPSERNRGLATELMRECIGRFKSMGMCAVTLIVGRNNWRALELYRKLGFRTFIEYDDELCLWLPFERNV
jgi:ribosomal protein S18 acetylase RimI-like enzyme